VRLSCQVKIKGDMKIDLPEEIFGIQKWKCRVRSNDNVATFIKELVLELPEGEAVPFRAGGYIQIECPPHVVEVPGLRDRPRVPRRLGSLQALEPGVRRERAGHTRLLDGELSRGARAHHAERSRGDSAAGRTRRSSGRDVVVHLLVEAQR
jgi:hypothetical protein